MWDNLAMLLISPLQMKILQCTAMVEPDTLAALLLHHQLALVAIRAKLELLKDFSPEFEIPNSALL